MTLRHFHGSTSSREGSVRALSPEMGAVGGKMSSPPSATRQVSPVQERKDEQQVRREKFHNSLQMHKVSAEGMLERHRKDAQGRERGKQGSPSHPMEVLSTAEVKEKIQQLGMPLGQQSKTVPKTATVKDDISEKDLHTGDVVDKNSTSPTLGQGITPPKGRGMKLLHYMSQCSGDERRSPVGSHSQKSPADSPSPRGVAGVNSSPEILQTALSQSAIRAKSPLSSDYFSSGDDSHSDRKQRARSVLQQLAARGKAKMSSEDEEQRRSLSPSGDASVNAASTNQMKVSPPIKSSSSPEDTVNRPPFRIRPAPADAADARSKEGKPAASGDLSSQGASPPKSNLEMGAIRKTFAATRNSQRYVQNCDFIQKKQTGFVI